MNPMDLAQSLSTRVKGRAEKRELDTKRNRVEERLSSIEDLLKYLQSEESEREDLSIRDLKKQVVFLQEMFKSELPQEILQIINEIPEVDEKELREAENFLQQQAEESGSSVAQMLEQFSQDEDEEIRERAVVLKQLLEAKNKIAFLKLKLREWMGQALGEMRDNTKTELGMTEDELRDLEERFKKIEIPVVDYATYAKEMEEMFVRTQVANVRRPLRTTDRESLEANERNIKVDEYLWKDFFQFLQQAVEEKIPDEAKRRNFLERVAGVTKPKVEFASSDLHEVILDKSIFSELGEEAKAVFDKFLQTKTLVDLKGQKDRGDNSNYLRESQFSNSVKVIDYLLEAEQLSAVDPKVSGGRNFLRTYYNIDENATGNQHGIDRTGLRKKIEGLIKNNPEFINKVEAVIRARGWGRRYSSPFFMDSNSDNNLKNEIALYGGNLNMPLEERDGIFFESAGDLGKRETEVAKFEQGLSDAVNNGRTSQDEVVITREDAIRKANSARQQAKDAELVARRKGEAADKKMQNHIVESQAEIADLHSQLNRAREMYDNLDNKYNRLRQEFDALNQEHQKTLASLREGREYMAELHSAIAKDGESLDEKNRMIRKIVDALQGSGFGKNGAVVDEIKGILGV